MPEKPTKELADDDEALQRYIEREGLVSFMNDTKWQELIETLCTIEGYSPAFKVKSLRDVESPTNWDISFPWHIPNCKTIEWIDFKTTTPKRLGALVPDEVRHFTLEIISALISKQIQFEIADTVIRVYGYKRPNAVG